MKKFFSHPFILSLLIIFFLILLNQQGFLNPVKNLFYSIITPGEKISYQISFKINELINFLVSINSLEEQNNQLKQENERLLGELSQLKEVSRENELLRQQIGVSEVKTRNLVMANIVGSDTLDLRRYFLINKGTDEGIKKGAAVIAAGDLLVGQIVEVNKTFSKVQAIVDPNSRINALIQETSITGLVRGEQGKSLVIDLLPQDKDIEQGQTIVSSGLAGFLPSGLLIGQIRQVISSDVQISQMAKIKPAVNFDSLQKVFVIIN